MKKRGTSGALGTISAAMASAELVVSEAALEAYGRADLDVMLATAPPRMPGAAPAEAQSA